MERVRTEFFFQSVENYAFENFEDGRKHAYSSNVPHLWKLGLLLAEHKNFGFFAVVGDCSKFPPPVEAALELG